MRHRLELAARACCWRRQCYSGRSARATNPSASLRQTWFTCRLDAPRIRRVDGDIADAHIPPSGLAGSSPAAPGEPPVHTALIFSSEAYTHTAAARSRGPPHLPVFCRGRRPPLPRGPKSRERMSSPWRCTESSRRSPPGQVAGVALRAGPSPVRAVVAAGKHARCPRWPRRVISLAGDIFVTRIRVGSRRDAAHVRPPSTTSGCPRAVAA